MLKNIFGQIKKSAFFKRKEDNNSLASCSGQTACSLCWRKKDNNSLASCSEQTVCSLC